MRAHIKGIGMMVGMMFGAGVFALPYAFLRAGLFWGLVHFAVAFFILAVLHLLYADVAYSTAGKHRITGYVGKYLGPLSKRVVLIITIASYYGTLLVYGLLGGLFLSNVVGAEYIRPMAIAFFIIAGVLIALRLTRIADINFYFTLPLFGFVLYLLIVALPSISGGIFTHGASLTISGDWFMPYGIWLFSLSGFAVLPEVRDIFRRAAFSAMKRTILWSLTLSAIFYFIFVIAVWGASGAGTTPDALGGLANVLGHNGLVIGSIIGFIAVFTSFMALGTDMKNIFALDYKIGRGKAWALTVIPPILLYLFGVTDFVRVLGLVGTLGFGVLGMFILFMHRKLRRSGTHLEKISFAPVLRGAVWLGILSGVAYELWTLFL